MLGSKLMQLVVVVGGSVVVFSDVVDGDDAAFASLLQCFATFLSFFCC